MQQIVEIQPVITLKIENQYVKNECENIGNQKEIWKIIPNYDNLYEISNMGNIRSLNKLSFGYENRLIKEKFLKPWKNNKGYFVISLNKEGKNYRILVHRLVALTFVSNDNNFPFVHHKNAIRDDNRAENLEWVTQKQNMIYASDNKNLKGENFRKITEKEVYEIRNKYLISDIDFLSLSHRYNISVAQIRRIIFNQRWKDKDYEQILNSKYFNNFKNSNKGIKSNKLKENDVIIIRKLYLETQLSYQKIANIFNVSRGIIYRIINNIAWKNI